MPPSKKSPLALVSDLLWVLFLIWTAVGFIVMPAGFSDVHVRALPLPEAVQGVLIWALQIGDAVWMTLAAANVYLATARHEGFCAARAWATIIVVVTGAIEWIGATTGFPFGPYRYTGNLGYRIAGVLPLTIPLAWLIVVLGARYVALAFLPGKNRTAVALWTGVLALLTDLNLEHVAWKIRVYWLWYPDWQANSGPAPTWPPAQNYLCWFLIAAALAAALPHNPRTTLALRQPTRPIVIFVLMNLLFLTIHAGWKMRG